MDSHCWRRPPCDGVFTIVAITVRPPESRSYLSQTLDVDPWSVQLLRHIFREDCPKYPLDTYSTVNFYRAVSYKKISLFPRPNYMISSCLLEIIFIITNDKNGDESWTKSSSVSGLKISWRLLKDCVFNESSSVGLQLYTVKVASLTLVAPYLHINKSVKFGINPQNMLNNKI